MKQQRIIQNFEVVLEPEDDGGYHIFCPALKGCHSYGATKEEAMEKIKEAIGLWLESAKELGIVIPERETVNVETK
ncbi:MAG: type II toxin-antitoxin system HicB family antitoxin [Dehalococcoidia bacterium]|nr:type II toxin-antitoxin system HicB family antitoxin [Dehalococcoidia bacterium]